MGRRFLLLAALALAVSNYAWADDNEGDEGGGSIVIEEDENGNIKVRVPKSAAAANKGKSAEDTSKLVPSGGGLLDKSTGTYYEPAGAKGYRNRRTGEYEKAWDCYPRR
ncbi:hypothetical protein [Methylogaea oryzae]|nr:hypothetical protein [Methylogaea oryzae]